MDPAQFAADTPGKLVPMQLRRREWAYVPDELPVSWEFAGEFWPLLAQAKEALGTLNGIGQTLPDPQLLVSPLQSREAIASSNIEGTFVTPEQLLLFKLDPKEPTSAKDPIADWMEVNSRSGTTLRSPPPRHGHTRSLNRCSKIPSSRSVRLSANSASRTTPPARTWSGCTSVAS